MKSLRNLARDTAGTAMLEFGFVAIALMSLLVGTMELGRFLWLEHLVENAAKQGARHATVRGEDSAIAATDDEIIAYVKGRVASIPADDLTVNITWDPDKKRGSRVSISITTTISPMASGLLPFEAYTVDGEASVIVAQ